MGRYSVPLAPQLADFAATASGTVGARRRLRPGRRLSPAPRRGQPLTPPLLFALWVGSGSARFAGNASGREAQPVFLPGRLHVEDDLAVFSAEVVQP
jgi:hypothetical protein